MTKTMKKLRAILKKTDKCPVCRSVFAGESLHPFDVAVREEFRVRRRRRCAALKGWKTRRKTGTACAEEGYCALHRVVHYEY